MHYARLSKSARLQRLLSLLSSGAHYTTREIIAATGICAVNSAASELRRNDIDVQCVFHGLTDTGERVYEYYLPARAA